MTLTSPANSPSRPSTSTLSMVVPSKTAYGWPCAAFRLISGARLLAAAGAAAACVGGAGGKLEERTAALSPRLTGSADGCEAPSSAETRFDAKRDLNASAFSASATGSLGGAAGGDSGAIGAAVPLTAPVGCMGEGAPPGVAAVLMFFCASACC